MKIHRTKWLGVVIVAFTLLLSAYLTFLKPGRGGLELSSTHRTARDLPQHVEVPEGMVTLTNLYRTINFIQKRYLDPERIDPRAMFTGGLRAIQLNVAQVLVNETDDVLLLKLGSQQKSFQLKKINTPWVLLQHMKEVFQLLTQEFPEDEIDLDIVEYAAINGMLRTLDPHSVFLNAEQYRDMRDKTQGNFAGLGIVISIRDGVLTIIAPIDGTPADMVGLEAGDQIVKIDEESTVNMALNDAVDRLRGDPGTAVTVHILRKGWDEPRPFTVTRAIVKVESLESHLLSGRVGYIKIKDFQGNTAADIHDLLVEWDREKVKGLVLDLRGCPGGLLEAAVQVADLFLRSGVIVTTAGQGPGERDVRRAEASGTEPDYPLVVLVDQGSASASEILAGALKNHHRALLVGERTFGKGSVQVLFEFQGDTPNKTTALKLTTAQYLTPGDISIQSVGVVPHIKVLPMRADEEMVDLEVMGGYRESDLDHHLQVAGKRADSDNGPIRQLSYLWVPPVSEKDKNGDDAEAEPPPTQYDKDKPFEPDFSVRLGRDLVVKTVHSKQGALDLTAVSELIEERSQSEDKRLEKALRELGVDWRTGKGAQDASGLKAAMSIEGGDPIRAGEEAVLTMSLSNNGGGTFYRLAATSSSDFRPLDDREVVFGQIGPGQTITRTLEFKVPKDALTEVNDVRFSFRALNSDIPDPAALRFSVTALPVPRFAYAARIDDTEKGNGNGKLDRGESVKLVVDVHNIGKGTAQKAYATLKSLSEKELFMIRGREPLETIEPNAEKQGVFSFEVKPSFAESEARFELAIADVDLRTYLVEKLVIPVYPAAAGEDVEGAKEKAFQPLSEKPNAPPLIAVDPLEAVTVADTIRIRGKATDESAVRDVYIFVGDDKRYFKSTKDSALPNELTFEAEVPLENGINYITIVAEESAELETRRILAVRRDRKDGMPYLLNRLVNSEAEPLGVFPQNAGAVNGLLATAKLQPPPPTPAPVESPSTTAPPEHE